MIAAIRRTSTHGQPKPNKHNNTTMTEQVHIVTGSPAHTQKATQAYMEKWSDGQVLSSAITISTDDKGKKSTTCMVVLGRVL